MTNAEHYSDQDYGIKEEGLQKIVPNFRGSSETTCSPSSSSSRRDSQEDPGLGVLVGSPNQHLRRHISHNQSNKLSNTSETVTMAEQQDEPPPSEEALVDLPALQTAAEQEDHGLKTSIDSAVDLSMSAVKEPEDHIDQAMDSKQFATRTRTDSMQVESLIPSKDKPSTRSGLASPLRIQTTDSNTSTAHTKEDRDSISSSPTLSKHVIPPSDIKGQSLAPFEPHSPTSNSPKAERLPSIHQITSSLTELAEAATQEIPRHQQGLSHHHSQSFGSATSHSPNFAPHPYPASIQTSPQAYYPPPILARSPTSTIGESQYASPPAYPPYGPYSHRRASMADGGPPLIPNLPTASSSGDSYGGYPSSGTEGYSTNHTTPIDIGPASDSHPRPMLPPPPGMHALAAPQPPQPAPIMIPGPYKCDVPNCTAGTFQTQYLLKYAGKVAGMPRKYANICRQLTQKCPQPKSPTLLSCCGLLPLRRRQRIQAQERDDTPWPGPQQPWLYLSVLSGAGAQVPATG